MIESGIKSNNCIYTKAIGLWQIIVPGRIYKSYKNNSISLMNVEPGTATRAAIETLRDLYSDW